ncbi:MAG: hypothetical protein MJ250_02995 [Alphaproteobacteria bacterium]|nr:hypothetical protein [Alphaproteobacteria bacterium]
MKTFIFILMLFVFQPANAFDESEYHLIDLRQRSYTQTGSSKELQPEQKATSNSSRLTATPSQTKPTVQPPPSYSNYSTRKKPKKNVMQPIEEDDADEEELSDEDKLKAYDAKKDLEIKNYIKNHPQTIPDV